MITVYGTARQRPTDKWTDLTSLPRQELEAEGETYEQARDALLALVPDGWLLLAIGKR